MLAASDQARFYCFYSLLSILSCLFISIIGSLVVILKGLCNKYVAVGYSVLFMSAYQMCHLWLKLPRPCMPVL